MSTWLDQLPSNERAKIRARLRSPEAYEKLREKVKGPEDLERDMEKNEALAELKFALETEPKAKNALKAQIEKDIAEQGIESMLGEVNPEFVYALEQGNFDVAVDSDQVVVIPEGVVAEKLPVSQKVSDTYIQQFVFDS